MGHMIDSFGYSKNIEKYVWFLGDQSVMPRVRCWGDDIAPEDAYKLARLDEAEPVLADLTYGSRRMSVSPTQYRAYERADGNGLIAIVGPKHRFLRNRDLMSFIPWPVHSAGSLEGGRRVFAQAKVPGIDLSVNRIGGRKLEIAANALFYNAHDGSARLRCRFCSTVTVCHNTVTAALSEAGMAEFSMRHTEQILDLAAVESAIAEMYTKALESYEEQRTVLQQFAETRFSRETARQFFATLLLEVDSFEEARPLLAEMAERKRIAESANKSDRSSTLFIAKGAELLNLFDGGLGQRADDTKVKLDALQAVTEFIDHQRARSADWRRKASSLSVGLNSQMFGQGNDTKQRAVKLLAKW